MESSGCGFARDERPDGEWRCECGWGGGVEGRRTASVASRGYAELLPRKDAQAMVARIHAEYCNDDEENDRVTKERRPMERRSSDAAIRAGEYCASRKRLRRRVMRRRHCAELSTGDRFLTSPIPPPVFRATFSVICLPVPPMRGPAWNLQ